MIVLLRKVIYLRKNVSVFHTKKNTETFFFRYSYNFSSKNKKSFTQNISSAGWDSLLSLAKERGRPMAELVAAYYSQRLEEQSLVMQPDYTEANCILLNVRINLLSRAASNRLTSLSRVLYVRYKPP